MMKGPADDQEAKAKMWTRRSAIGATAAALSIAAISRAQGTTPPRRSRLILLGTKGGPTPSRFRAPAANLLIVDGKPIVIDCPDGVARQLVIAGVNLAELGDVFVTHHHSDHNAGLSSLLLLAWGSGLKTPVDIYGPPPLARIVAAGMETNRFDIEVRMKEEGRPPLAPLARPHEHSARAVILERPGLRVTCAPVDHYTVPALAYRFDTPDRSIVFSGDTAPSESLIELARGADILVHEAMLLEAVVQITDGNAPTLRDHLIKSHTTTEQLGRVAAAAGVRTLVLSHLVPALPTISDAKWIEGVRRHFKGEIIVGRDLMEI